MNWDDLSKNALRGFLNSKRSKKRYTEFEAEGMTEKIIKTIKNNKVILSFGQGNELKLNIKPLSSTENRWFINGYKKIMNKLNGNVEILTLNYDLTLETILSRKDINLLTESPTKISEEVIHLHGVIDSSGLIVKDSLLTLKNYVENSKKIEEIFSKHLLKDSNVSNTWETIIIIGSSMQEEHLLRVLKKFKEKNKFKNIILLDHLPNDKFFLSKVSEIYEELSIKLVNINSGQSYKKDFIDFWKCLCEKIHDGIFSGDFNEISTRDDLNEHDLFIQLKEKAQKTNSKTLKELFQNIKWSEESNATLIRPIFWLEKEKLLENKSLKTYVFENFATFPIESLNFIINDIETYNEKLRVLKSINVISAEFNSFGYHHYQYESMIFLEKFILDIEKRDFLKCKNLIKFLIHSILDRPTRIKEDIKNYLIDIVSSEEIFKISTFSLIRSFPSNNDFIFKVIQKDYKNQEKWISLIPIPKTIKDFFNLMKKLILKYDKWQILYIFTIEEFSEYIKLNFKNILEILPHYENISLKNIIFSIIYFTLINNKKYNSNFLSLVRKSDFVFKTFPDSLSMLGCGGTNSPTLSEYDGKLINSEINSIESFEQFRRIVNKNTLTEPEKHSIVDYIRRKISLELLKNISTYESLKNWWHYDKFKTIIIKCENWNEYLNFIKINHKIRFIKIQPPFDIYKRTEELANSINEKFNDGEYNELISLLEIRNYLGYYSNKHFWWNREIKISMKYREKNRKAWVVLSDIFSKVFKWKKEKVIGMLEKNDYPIKELNEAYFLMEYNGENLATVKKMTELFSKECENNKIKPSVRVFSESVDWIIRSEPGREIWNKKFVFVINYLESLNKKYNYNEIPNIINNFYNKICYNILMHKTNKITNNIKIKHVFNILFRIDNLVSIDEEIVDLLNESIDDNSNTAWWYLSMINDKKMGKSLKNWIFEQLINWVDMLNENSFIYNGETIMEFINSLDKDPKEEILNKINEKKLDFNNQ